MKLLYFLNTIIKEAQKSQTVTMPNTLL